MASEGEDAGKVQSGRQLAHCPGICCACIPSGSVGVVQDLGEYKGWIEPGCTCYCPGIRTIAKASLAVQMLDCLSECKTKDSVIITVKTAVQFRVNKRMLKEAIFDIVDPRTQIQAYVDSVLRSTLPTLDLDEAYSAKEKMCDQILDSVRNSMAKYGHDIINVLVTDLQPERGVQQAMNAINAARRQREAAAEQAEAQKIIAVKSAEADAESKYLSGEGIARMRTAMAKGFKESMDTMSAGGLSPQEAMHMMITTQYLDTLKDFATNPNGSSIVVPHGAGAVKDIEAQVRDGFIQASALGGSKKPGQVVMR
jgi:regulator of protease activity HflC (stomatin/prohibitin superfamily)